MINTQTLLKNIYKEGHGAWISTILFEETLEKLNIDVKSIQEKLFNCSYNNPQVTLIIDIDKNVELETYELFLVARIDDEKTARWLRYKLENKYVVATELLDMSFKADEISEILSPLCDVKLVHDETEITR